MTDLTVATRAGLAALDALDAVCDDQLGEATDLCATFGIPEQYARNVAAIVSVCNPDGAL